jgi:hypothetical protein
MYLPPFTRFQQTFTVTEFRGAATAMMSLENLKAMVRGLLQDIPIDTTWYLERYPDVASAIRSGVFGSAKAHFLAEGYFEGRRPFPIEVDEAWYLRQYPEVANAVRSGVVGSAQQHFDENGYREGRLPRLPAD